MMEQQIEISDLMVVPESFLLPTDGMLLRASQQTPDGPIALYRSRGHLHGEKRGKPEDRKLIFYVEIDGKISLYFPSSMGEVDFHTEVQLLANALRQDKSQLVTLVEFVIPRTKVAALMALPQHVQELTFVQNYHPDESARHLANKALQKARLAASGSAMSEATLLAHRESAELDG